MPTLKTRRSMMAKGSLGGVVLCLLLAACGDLIGSDRVRGSGEVRVESRSIGEFERIVLAGEGGVALGTAEDGQIEIETDDNLLPHIRTEVAGNTLTISTEPGVDIDPTNDVTYRVGCHMVTDVVLSGAGRVDVGGCTTEERLELELSGAGSIVADDLDVSTLRASLPGAGKIMAAGRADQLDVVLAGAGGFDGEDLRAEAATVDSSGAGSATVWAVDRLDVSITGVGSVRYRGEPQVATTITGTGAIEPLGPK